MSDTDDWCVGLSEKVVHLYPRYVVNFFYGIIFPCWEKSQIIPYIIQDQEKAVVPLIVHRCNCVDLCFKHKSNSCNLIDSFAKGKGLLFQGKPLQN